MARNLCEAFWRMALLGQAIHHATRPEDVAVDRRHRRSNHHDIEQGRRRADAQAVENLYKRTALATDLRPRVNGHQYKQGQHVEQQDTQRHGVDRFGDHTFRVFGLTGRDANDFNAAEREHHHRKRGNQPAHAIGHKATERPQIADPGRGGVCTARAADAKQHDAETGQNHRHDGGDFEQRQPEFHLAKDFDAAQVQAANQQHDAQHPDPARHVGEPEPHVNAECRDVGQAHDDHFKRVGPTEDEPRHRAQIGAGVMAKRPGHRIAHGHFAQCAHDHEYGGATYQVRQQDRGASHLDGRSRTVKQPRPDR